MYGRLLRQNLFNEFRGAKNAGICKGSILIIPRKTSSQISAFTLRNTVSDKAPVGAPGIGYSVPKQRKNMIDTLSFHILFANQYPVSGPPVTVKPFQIRYNVGSIALLCCGINYKVPYILPFYMLLCYICQHEFRMERTKSSRQPEKTWRRF